MIREFIKKHFEKKLESGSGLVVYDSELFYRDIVLGLESEVVKVFDASKNVVTAREEALEYWVNEMPKKEQAKVVLYVPFQFSHDADEKISDPFIIFSSGGTVFPNEAADDYKQLCIASLPEKEDKIEAIFAEEHTPSFATIDALKGGNTYPKLKSGLNAGSGKEILMAILVPSETQLNFLSTDKTWMKELRSFSKNVLGVTLQKRNFETISEEFWNLVLFSEFVHDLNTDLPLPEKLKQVPLIDKANAHLIKDVCHQLRQRKDVEETYVRQAERVSSELSLADIFEKETQIGLINTFAFEDTILFKGFRDLLLSGSMVQAEDILNSSIKSIWCTYDSERKTAWIIARKAIDIKKTIDRLNKKVKGLSDLNSVVAFYAEEMYQLDTLHRELNKNVADAIVLSGAQDEVFKYSVNAYSDFTERLQKVFIEGVEKDGLKSLSIQRNIDLFDNWVDPIIKSGKKTVYFLVDALRYELACHLKSRLERASFDAEIEPALAFVPTVTKYAMAALMPGASKNLSLRTKGEKMEAYLSDAESSTRDSRVKYVQNVLGDKASWTWEKSVLTDDYEKSDVLFVTTTEIDEAGERSPDNAQLQIEQALNKILKVSSKLRDAGYEEFVLVADHGFVLLNEFKAGNKADKPVGEWVLKKSRCLAGKGASNTEHIELSADDLGVKSDVNQFLFLKNYATYERGKQFFHEGLSLQEVITPCLSYRPQKTVSKDPIQVNLTYKGKTNGVITTLRPSLELATFGQSLFGEAMDIQIDAVSGDKVVGELAPSEAVNTTTGYLEVDEGATLKFSLKVYEDFEGEFTVYAKSPATGIILSELQLSTDFM